MKFLIPQSKLVRDLQLLGVIVKRGGGSIGDSILFNVGENILTISANDLTTNINITEAIDLKGGGKFAVGLGQLFEYVSMLNDDLLSLSIKNDVLVVEQQGSMASFTLLNPKGFDLVAINTSISLIKMSIQTLSGMLRQVGISISTDESRPVLTSFLFRFNDSGLSLVGTDGYRLGLASINKKNLNKVDLLIPAKTLLGVLRSLDDGDIELGVDNSHTQIWLRMDNKLIAIRQVMGDFPNYEKILPHTFTTKITVNSSDLLKTVRRLAVFARQNANVIFWEIDGAMSLSTKASAIGESVSSLDGKVEGEKLKIAFNYRYFLEYLSVIGDREVVIEFNGPIAPTRLLVDGEEDFVQIIMPVKP